MLYSGWVNQRRAIVKPGQHIAFYETKQVTKSLSVHPYCLEGRMSLGLSESLDKSIGAKSARLGFAPNLGSEKKEI